MVTPIVPEELSKCRAGVLIKPVPMLSLMLPDPLAVSITDVPPVSVNPAMSMEPLLAVVVRDNAPEACSAVAAVILLSFDTDKPENVSPPDDRLKAPANVLTTVALPVVFSVKPVVDVAILPIVPEPEESDIDVLPESVPPD